MSNEDDFYALLGVDSDAPTGDIRSAYRDKKAALGDQGDKTATARLNKAWNVLSDPYQRGRYDEQRMRAAGGDGDGDGVEVSTNGSGGGSREKTTVDAQADAPVRRRLFEPRPRRGQGDAAADDRAARGHVVRAAALAHHRDGHRRLRHDRAAVRRAGRGRRPAGRAVVPAGARGADGHHRRSARQREEPDRHAQGQGRRRGQEGGRHREGQGRTTEAKADRADRRRREEEVRRHE